MATPTLVRPRSLPAARPPDAPARVTPGGRIGLGAVLLVGFALRLHLLAENGVWWDEGWSVWLARQRPDLIARFTAADQHPPLHYWFLWGWDRLAGESAFATRYASVLFGIALLPVAYVVGRRLGGAAAGLLAAAVLALSRFDIWWSQEVRMYTPALLLVGISTYALLRLAAGGPARLWAGWALASLAGLLLTYLYAVVAAQALAFLLGLPGRGRWSGWRGALALALASGAIAGGFLPWWLYRLPYANHWPSGAPFDPTLAARVYAAVLTLGVSTDLDGYLAPALALLAAALAGAGVLATSPFQRWAALLLLLLTAGPAAAVYALSRLDTSLYAATLQARYFLPALPSYAVLVGVALAAVWRRWRPAGAVAAAAAMGLGAWTLPAYYDGRMDDHSFATAANFIATYARGDDALFLYPDTDWPVFFYHYPRGIDWYRLPGGVRMTPEEAERWLAPAAGREAVWLVTSRKAFVNDPARAVPAWLEARYAAAARLRAGELEVTLYTRDGSPGGRTSAVPSPEFGVRSEGLSAEAAAAGLAGYDALPSQAPAGATVHLVTYWRGAAPAGLAAAVRAAEGAARPGRRVDTLEAVGPVQRVQFDLALPPGAGSAEITLDAGGHPLLRHWLRVLAAPDGGGPAPSELTPADVRFGPAIRLTGWAIRRTAGELAVDLAWEAEAPPPLDYTLFVHLSAADERILAQNDGVPGRPTSAWAAGERVAHTVRLRLPDNASGAYTLYIGLYDPLTFRRLPVAPAGASPDPDARLRLATVELP